MSGDLTSDDLDAVKAAVSLLQSHGYRVEKIERTHPEGPEVYTKLAITFPSRSAGMEGELGERVGWFIPDTMDGDKEKIADAFDLLEGPYAVDDDEEEVEVSGREAYALREVDV